MTGWKDYRLENLYSFGSGLSKPANEFGFGYPFLTFKEVFNNYFVSQKLVELVNSTEKEREVCSIKRGDVFLTRTSEVAEELGMSSVALKDYPQATFNGFTKRLRPKDGTTVWPEFIGYHLRWQRFRAHIVSMSSETTRASLNNTMMATLPITLPPLPEQKAIAAVLSSFDDKIDLLHRQNATLEAMAEALFRQWFVVEAKDEWEEKPLLHYVKLIGGGTPKTSVNEYWGGSTPWLSGGDIAGAHKSFALQSAKNITEDGINNSSAKLLPQFATVLTARGTVGKFCLLGRPMAYSQTNYGILPADGQTYFFTFLLVDRVIKELQMAAYGSVFDTITTQTFEEIKILLPEDDVILKFEDQIINLFSKMFSNQTQIRTLEKLRDTLLPKLMSGEVRVEF